MTGEVVPMKPGAPIKALIPNDLDQAWRLAKIMSASGLAPHGLKTPEQVAVAILHGMEIGLPPMQAVQRIAVINGRPSIWGEAIPALLYSKGFKIEEKELIRANTVGEVNGYECTVIRPDGERITRKFTESDAKAAGLLNKKGPWQEYRKRMLQMRARGLAARDGAADALSGLYLAEESQDIEPIDITPEVEQIGVDPHETDDKLVALLNNPCFEPNNNRPTVYKYKQTIGDDSWHELNGSINDCETREKLAQIPDLFSEELLAMPKSMTETARDQIRERWLALEEVNDEQPDSQ